MRLAEVWGGLGHGDRWAMLFNRCAVWREGQKSVVPKQRMGDWPWESCSRSVTWMFSFCAEVCASSMSTAFAPWTDQPWQPALLQRRCSAHRRSHCCCKELEQFFPGSPVLLLKNLKSFHFFRSSWEINAIIHRGRVCFFLSSVTLKWQ